VHAQLRGKNIRHANREPRNLLRQEDQQGPFVSSGGAEFSLSVLKKTLRVTRVGVGPNFTMHS